MLLMGVLQAFCVMLTECGEAMEFHGIESTKETIKQVMASISRVPITLLSIALLSIALLSITLLSIILLAIPVMLH